ncbi:F-box protein CPR30-like [Chenopodium quinoa]|uniref:F-box domain-containing protein n=1 Tax=Chenopodium quinoa TaxID=63459 RepID=A0A803L8R8_CHEQI|nr:F-box protein CPR30-like [Chenopodium quinoa]
MSSIAEVGRMERELSRVDRLSEDIHFPPELLLEILLWLPSKTLLKFRSVCRIWCSFIDSSNFISLHLNCYNYDYSQKSIDHLIAIQRIVDVGCFFTIRSSDRLNTVADLAELAEPYSISGNCNGLILLNYGWNAVRLWNPSIRKSLFLPDCPIKLRWSRIRRCHVTYTLGFSRSSNDYKVLAVKTNLPSYSDDKAYIAVYSLADHLWRVKPNPVSVSKWAISWLSPEGGLVCCGGVVYWVDNDLHRKPGAYMKLYLYDFDVEEFSVMQLPDAVKESTHRLIFAHGDSLAVLLMSSESICIWVLKKDGGENPWRLWFKGEPHLNASKLFECANVVYCKNSNTFLLNNNLATMSYDIANNQIRILKEKDMMNFRISFQTYVESLVLHKGFGETITLFL